MLGRLAGGPSENLANLRYTRAAAVLGVAATWILILVGGFVRVTESGMGCPDWPRCYGQWVPPANWSAVIEVAHRYAAGTVSLIVVGAAVLAFRSRSAAPGAWRGAALAVALIVVQIGLGAWTVFAGNRPDTVVAHLVAALATLGALTWAAARATTSAPSRGSWPAWALAGATLLLATIGGAVQVLNGGFACPEFPLCGGLWPSAGGAAAQMHMLHRYLALGAGFLLVPVTWRVLRDRTAGSTMAAVAIGIYLVQVAVGVAQVLTDMPPGLRLAHLGLGAAFWAATVHIAATGPSPRIAAAAPSF